LSRIETIADGVILYLGDGIKETNVSQYHSDCQFSTGLDGLTTAASRYAFHSLRLFDEM
jgi:hypothetical protein